MSWPQVGYGQVGPSLKTMGNMDGYRDGENILGASFILALKGSS